MGMNPIEAQMLFSIRNGKKEKRIEFLKLMDFVSNLFRSNQLSMSFSEKFAYHYKLTNLPR